MGLVDWIVFAVIALILGGAIAYIIWQKKKGKKCIGCPYADNCSSCKDSCQNNQQ